MMCPLIFRKGPAFFAGLILLAVACQAQAEERRLQVTQVQVDTIAKTLTISVSHLEEAKHLGAPKVRLAGSPLVVSNSVINIGAHTGVITANLPSPIPTGSFLLEVAWGRDGDDAEHAFSLTIGIVGPQGPQGPVGPQGASGLQGLSIVRKPNAMAHKRGVLVLCIQFHLAYIHISRSDIYGCNNDIHQAGCPFG